jgi:hypothetical protein
MPTKMALLLRKCLKKSNSILIWHENDYEFHRAAVEGYFTERVLSSNIESENFFD